MSIATRLTSTINDLKDAYDAIAEKGGTIPEHKNYANLEAAIESIGSEPIIPGSFGDFKQQLDDGTAFDNFPVGTEIPDDSDASNPWIVADYRYATLSNGQLRQGAYLFKKYSIGNYAMNSVDYSASSMNTYLNSQYFNSLPKSIQDGISEISVPYYAYSASGPVQKAVNAKVWLMSCTEVMALGGGRIEGTGLEYWRQATGLSTPDNNAYAGRIMTNTSNAKQQWWLRSYSTSNGVYTVYTNGGMLTGTVGSSFAVVPACFIARTAAIEPGSLDDLKQHLSNGTAEVNFPIGTEIPDVYNSNSNPLIVAQYLNSSNNSSYGGAEGVVLVRKYVDPISQEFNPGRNAVYSPSTIKTFLDTTYLNNCSDSIKFNIDNINIPYYNGSTMTTVSSKWFLMSAYEMCNQGKMGAQGYEGIMWDYWKQKTGLTSPDAMYSAKSGRIVRGLNGSAQSYWLRSWFSSEGPCAMSSSGDVATGYSSYTYGVLPACFIAKSSGGGVA